MIVSMRGPTGDLLAASDRIERGVGMLDRSVARVVAPTEDRIALVNLWASEALRRASNDDPAHREIVEGVASRNQPRYDRAPVRDPARGPRIRLASGAGPAVEFNQQLAQLLHASFAEPPRPLLLDRGDDAERLADLGPAPISEEDQAGAPVGRVGATLHIPVLLEVVDEVAHRLLGHLRPLGKLGEARALRLDVLEDRGVGGANVVEAGLDEALGDSLHDLLERTAKQDPNVGTLVAGLAPKDGSVWLGLAG
jgi:hypothetical protein